MYHLLYLVAAIFFYCLEKKKLLIFCRRRIQPILNYPKDYPAIYFNAIIAICDNLTSMPMAISCNLGSELFSMISGFDV